MSKEYYILDSKERVEYNGKIFHLRVKTRDLSSPVVLFLHGGTGSPDRGHVMKYQSPLAKQFTLVCYDQRGAGLAYDKKEANTLDLTREIYMDDIHTLIAYLKERFIKDKIILVGHSFGSVLGVWYANEYPEDLLAYVGIGQCVDYGENERLSYNWVLEKAKEKGDKKAIKTLELIGAPDENGSYKVAGDIMKQRAILHEYGGATYANNKPYWQELLHNDVPIILKEYGICGTIKYIKGIGYTSNTTLARTNPNFLENVKSLNVPVYILQGEHDVNTNTALVKRWFDTLNAPTKQLVLFSNSAHSPQWEENEEWNNQFTKLFIK